MKKGVGAVLLMLYGTLSYFVVDAVLFRFVGKGCGGDDQGECMCVIVRAAAMVFAFYVGVLGRSVLGLMI